MCVFVVWYIAVVLIVGVVGLRSLVFASWLIALIAFGMFGCVFGCVLGRVLSMRFFVCVCPQPTFDSRLLHVYSMIPAQFAVASRRCYERCLTLRGLRGRQWLVVA